MNGLPNVREQMLDPFDKSRCSFPVPDFNSEAEEVEWARSLAFEQSIELVYWMNVYRWGEDAVNAPMDRTKLEVLTMEEFDRMKQREEEEERTWRIAHGLPPRY